MTFGETQGFIGDLEELGPGLTLGSGRQAAEPSRSGAGTWSGSALLASWAPGD